MRRGGDVVAFAAAGREEALVDVVDHVGRAQVQVGADGGHVGCREAGQHQPAQAGRQVVNHHPDVRAFRPALRCGGIGQQHQRDQRGQDPWPGAQRVVGDVEPEGRAQGVLLVLRGKDALGDVAAAAGLGPGIPACPPVQRDQDEETEEEGRRGGRDEGESVARLAVDAVNGIEGADAIGQRVHSADGVDGKVREQDHHAHLQDELDQVRPKHSPHAGDGVVGEGEGEAAEDRGELLACSGEAKGQREDLRHGQVHPAHDDGVDREGQVNGAKAAQEGGGRAGVAELGELHVGQHAGAAPQRGEEEDGEHPGEQERPPQPVAGDALAVDEAGDDQRRVGGEGGGHHGSPGQPPGDVAAGEEELADVAGRALHVEEADGEVDRKISGDHQPIERRKNHRASTCNNVPSYCIGERRTIEINFGLTLG